MNLKVLLVDDEEEFVETLAERLGRRNMDVQYVLSGSEAIKKLKEESFDVIVLDVLMPGMDGIHTYNEIREIDPLTHVIMLTGHAKVETAIEGMKAGVYDYLIKPVKIEELVAKINMAHNHRSVNEERLKRELGPE